MQPVALRDIRFCQVPRACLTLALSVRGASMARRNLSVRSRMAAACFSASDCTAAAWAALRSSSFCRLTTSWLLAATCFLQHQKEARQQYS